MKLDKDKDEYMKRGSKPRPMPPSKSVASKKRMLADTEYIKMKAMHAKKMSNSMGPMMGPGM